MASGPIASWQIEGGKVEAVWVLKSPQMVTAAMKLVYCCFLAGKL